LQIFVELQELYRNEASNNRHERENSRNCFILLIVLYHINSVFTRLLLSAKQFKQHILLDLMLGIAVENEKDSQFLVLKIFPFIVDPTDKEVKSTQN
jgi:hypothetical protein